MESPGGQLEQRGPRMEALKSGAKTGLAQHGNIRAPLPLSWDVTWGTFPFLVIVRGGLGHVTHQGHR